MPVRARSWWYMGQSAPAVAPPGVVVPVPAVVELGPEPGVEVDEPEEPDPGELVDEAADETELVDPPGVLLVAPVLVVAPPAPQPPKR